MNTAETQALALIENKPEGLIRHATDVAGVCREIVLRTVSTISGRRFVRVEGWQSIATAHGCIASSRDVEKVLGGFRAIGEIKRISDGMILAVAEGFVGEDETTWFGGEAEVWDKTLRKRVKKLLPKRSDYAIRAMAQTRAISRVCRSAFAHVVVMIDQNLSTTPAEEVPEGGFEPGDAVGATITVEPPSDSPKEEKPLKSTYSPQESITDRKARVARLEVWLVKCKAQLILELAEKERMANEYAQKHGLCLPNETIADVEVGKLFPSVNMDGTVESNKEAVAKDFTTLSKAIEAFGSGGEPDTDDVNSPNSPWRAFPMPFGKQAGVKLADLEKNYLFGLWANYTVEMEYNGKPKRPQTIEKDRVFRKMLDRAGEHYEFVKKD